MKNLLTLLFIVFLYQISVAQNYKAIYYGKLKTLNYDSILNNDKKFKKYNNDIYKKALLKEQEVNLQASKTTKLILKYNQNESLFFIEKPLEKPKFSRGTYNIRLGVKGTYYSTKNEILLEKNSYGQDFIVKIPKLMWEITNVSKKIGKYYCFKAKTIKEVENSKGIHKIEIIAWFSPQLPFNFGPKEFNGLPGLIIELQEGGKTYSLKRIEQIDNFNFKKPTKGKLISLKDFNILSKKMYDKIRIGKK